MDPQRLVELRAGLLRLRTTLQGEGASPLDVVGLARRIAQEAHTAFVSDVKVARGGGHAWDRIAEHVPGFGPAPGDDSAQRLFEFLTSASADRSVTWRCAGCDGVVVDRGPYGGHPSNAEQGRRQDCERHRRDVERYVAELRDFPASAPPAAGPGARPPVGQGLDLALGLE